MKLICNNGFYKFFPDFVGEIKLWENKNGIRLFRRGDYWTFEQLVYFPEYSIKGFPLWDLYNGEVNLEATPEEIMGKNNLTFDLKKLTITPRADVVLRRLDYSEGAFLTFPELPQAFALDKDAEQIVGFEAFVDVRLNQYRIERFFYA